MSERSEPRYEFYETDDQVILSIFDKGVAPEDVFINFSPRHVSYVRADKELALEPLTGEIEPIESGYTVGRFKVEVILLKKSLGRWRKLVDQSLNQPPEEFASATAVPAKLKPPKNWEGIAEEAIKAEPEDTDDPNVGGDAAINKFFQKLFADADDDTKKAMLKSYQESGGTTLSTNWDGVKQKKVEVKSPEGSEWKQWG